MRVGGQQNLLKGCSVLWCFVERKTIGEVERKIGRIYGHGRGIAGAIKIAHGIEALAEVDDVAVESEKMPSFCDHRSTVENEDLDQGFMVVAQSSSEHRPN